ncbi:nucleotidyl transferase AbiEii/AbiGii toxin family protein [Tsukamurella columbiensis]|uniref:Nucleotidyl transferase AbiEii/AbiGii toxin family protein n=1 Tax=Tsukamurella columbiensis TaxID=128509 RepID=A0ABX1LLW4_9ACTN|nr:nucleotidyl transferase AbiEii/AbiGii toxin family protein [Tsukamurella columbiensis]NMD58008.1 nucleotidyl transferase AbiEii/AbiGii toxin family protein [Tsukamurella columbiensis]
MTGPQPRSERAIRAALTDRLKAEGRRSGRELQDVRRQFVLRRFLTRVFADQPDQWILKGGTAMVLRLPNARPSKDLDLLRRDSTDLDQALRDLRLAAARPDVDPFTFRVTRAEERDDLEGFRVTIGCWLGPTEFDKFPIDLVVGKGGFIGPVEHYPTVDRFAAPPEFSASVDVAVYPVSDQVADKLAAMYERHGRDLASTRHHDLADLLLLEDHFPIDHDVTVAALDNQKHVREGLVLPAQLVAPDPDWYTKWPKIAATSQLPASLHDLDAALAHGRRCYDTLLQADATAAPRNLTWTPSELSWNPHAPRTDEPAVTPRMYAALRAAGTQRATTTRTTNTPAARPKTARSAAHNHGIER